jgi:hypothetical protein
MNTPRIIAKPVACRKNKKACLRFCNFSLLR